MGKNTVHICGRKDCKKRVRYEKALCYRQDDKIRKVESLKLTVKIGGKYCPNRPTEMQLGRKMNEVIFQMNRLIQEKG